MVAVSSVVQASAAPATAERRMIPAFPRAEGFGAYAMGGRGGKVMVVTNLRDYAATDEPIPGSFRAAVTAEGPRIVVFAVSGLIELKEDVKVTTPYLTLAGQTAPGDGVCLKGGALCITNTHDVVVRQLRYRRGDENPRDGDSILVEWSQDVIFDHCSASWSIDETASFSGLGLKNVTVQWCMLTESLNNSHHKKGPNGFGSVLSSDNGGVTVHHTLYAHNNSHNPRFAGQGRGPGLLADFRNNVIYNWGTRVGDTGESLIRVNYVNNYLKPGPSTDANAHYAFLAFGPYNHFFLSGNIFAGWEAATKDNSLLVNFPPRVLAWSEADKKAVLATEPFLVPEVKTDSADGLLKKVLAGAGATLPKRDAVDARIAEEVANGTGRIIDSQDQVGGWPQYATAEAPKDSDQDGMPDEWEIKNGLNPKDAADAAFDNDEDGYTSIEEYINKTPPQDDEENKMVLPPTIKPDDGTMFDKTATVRIMPNASRCTIRYTTDGSEPTASSPVYARPFTIDKTTVVKARAFKRDLESIRAYATISKIAGHEGENPSATQRATTGPKASASAPAEGKP
jgi:pectate lyase